MTEIDAWKKVLWEALDQLPPDEQFMVSGRWITEMTQQLLPALGYRRRENVVDMVELEHIPAAKVADILGLRRSTLTRLLDEGRAARKAVREREDAQDPLTTPHPSL